MVGVEGEEADDAPLRADHRLHFARRRLGVGFEFEIFEADAALDHAHEARIDFVAGRKHGAKFGDRLAQALALVQRAVFVAAPRQIVADAAAGKRRSPWRLSPAPTINPAVDNRRRARPRGRRSRTRARSAHALNSETGLAEDAYAPASHPMTPATKAPRARGTRNTG